MKEETANKSWADKLFSIEAALFIASLGVVAVIVAAFAFGKGESFSTDKLLNASKVGQLGDLIGGLAGSLWALAGVILFYVALKEQRTDFKTNQKNLTLQNKMLQAQIKEFKLQKVELEETRKVFTEQSKTLKKQQFEATFFNTMSMLNSIIESITYVIEPQTRQIFQRADRPAFPQPDRTKVYYGRDCFEFFYQDLRKEYEKLTSDYVLANLLQLPQQVDKFDIPQEMQLQFSEAAYVNFFEKEHSDLGHYFRTIYNIIKFVNDNEVENSKYYTSLLRAQLSTYEHLLLFYNGQSQFGIAKLKPLIIKYSMLDNMATSELLGDQHKNFYPPKAYE